MLITSFNKKIRFELAPSTIFFFFVLLIGSNLLAFGIGSAYLILKVVPAEYAKVEADIAAQKKQIDEQKIELQNIITDFKNRFAFVGGQYADSEKPTVRVKKESSKKSNPPPQVVVPPPQSGE